MEIVKFFLPDAHRLLYITCYLIVISCAYKRYNSIAYDYGTFDTARLWTTWARYNLSATIYILLIVNLFAVIFNLLVKYPFFIDLVVDNINNAELANFLNGLKNDASIAGPIFSTLGLTWGIQKFSILKKWDKGFRWFFQQLGSIPKKVADTIKEMKGCKIPFDVIDKSGCLIGLSDEMQSELLLPNRNKDEKSLEKMYLNACHLYCILSSWNNSSSQFFHFSSVYKKQYNNILNTYETINKNIRRYYSLFLNFKSNTAKVDIQKNKELLKFFKDFQREIREELKRLLEDIYTFIACAVHSKGLSERSRKEYLKDFGFDIDKCKIDRQIVDWNDLAILSLFLFFIVIPSSVILSQLLLGVWPNTLPIYIIISWSSMALFVGLASIFSVLFTRRQLEFSDNAFWKRLRSDIGKPWCSYCMAGIIAGIMSFFGIGFLSYINWKSEILLSQRLRIYTPWSFVAVTLSVMIAYHLDEKSSQGKLASVYEVITTSIATVFGSVVAMFIMAGKFDITILYGKKSIFPFMAAFLLGGIIGGIFPKRYRSHSKQKQPMNNIDVNIKELVSKCVDDFSGWAEEEEVKVRFDCDNDILAHVEEKKIKQVVKGLLSNALIFTQEGGEIVIEVHKVHDGGIEISVKDNGIGISKEIVDEVNSLSDLTEELSIEEYPNLKQMKSIVKQYGGDLLIKKAQDGTETLVEFPKDIVISSV